MKDRGAWCVAVHGVTKSLTTTKISEGRNKSEKEQMNAHLGYLACLQYKRKLRIREIKHIPHR